MEDEAKGQIQREQWLSKISEKPAKAPKSVSYGQLGVLVFTFIVGVVVTLIFQNITKLETITFSTVNLVSFLSSVALAGASIFLAITAITLSKASEQVMIDRSDESIRLQSEVFTKTTEALRRIESSTGVTEKRIEDMISGRAGDISERVAERAVDDRLVTGRSRRQLKEEIRQSILSELSETTVEQRRKAEVEEQKEKDEARKRYRQFKNAVLLGLANNPIVESVKIGDGHYGEAKEGLMDGVFIIDGLKFGISAFPGAKVLQNYWLDGFLVHVKKSAQEISESTFAKVIFAFEGELSEDNDFHKQFTQAKALLQKNVADKLFIVSGSPEEINQHILSIIKHKKTDA